MISAILLSATLQVSDTPLTATVTVPKKVHAGKLFVAVVKLHFGDGLHGYQNPPTDKDEIPVEVTVASGAKLISVKYPKGVDLTMAGSPPTKVYSGDVTVQLSLKAPKKSGPLVVNIGYQQCTDSNCFPPAKAVTKANLSVTP